MSTSYILRGRDAEGNQSFYTGRAGDGWVSADPKQAFGYTTLAAASRKAALFNNNQPLHGLYFVAMGWNADGLTVDQLQAFRLQDGAEVAIVLNVTDQTPITVVVYGSGQFRHVIFPSGYDCLLTATEYRRMVKTAKARLAPQEAN